MCLREAGFSCYFVPSVGFISADKSQDGIKFLRIITSIIYVPATIHRFTGVAD